MSRTRRVALIGAVLLAGCGHRESAGTCKAGRITYDGAPVVLSHVLIAQWGAAPGSGSPGIGYDFQLANHSKITCDMMRALQRTVTIEDGDLALQVAIFPGGEAMFKAGVDLGVATGPSPTDHLIHVRVENPPVNVGDPGTICVPEKATWDAEMFDGKHHTFTIEGAFSGTFCGARID